MNKKKRLLIIIGIIISFVLISGFTYGKYIYNSVFDYYLESKGFYFSSDYLSANGETNVNSLWDEENVNFNIKNSINDTLISDYDIDYNVTCSIISDNADKLGCNLMNSSLDNYSGVLSASKKCINNSDDLVDVNDLDEISCERAGYTYESVETESDLFFNIINNDNNYIYKDVKVKLEIKSVYPYSKTLTATYELHKVNNEDKISINYKQFGFYDRLIISNSFLTNKRVTIKFNPDDYRIILDNSNVVTTTNSDGYIDSITFNVLSMKSISYMFEKLTTNDIKIKEDFVYEYNDY